MILSSFIVIQMNMPWQTMMYLSAFLIVCMMIAFALVIRSNKEDVAFLESQAAAEEETTDQPKEKFPFRPCSPCGCSFTYVLYLRRVMPTI